MQRLIASVRFFCLLFAPCLLYPLAARATGLTPDGLRCEYAASPMGLEMAPPGDYSASAEGVVSARPRVSWRLKSDERAQKQTAYEINVASSPDKLRSGASDIWNTGRVASGQSVLVEYGGAPLESERHYWWRVRVWDKNGRVGKWSQPAEWEMGLLDPSLKQAARWITAADPPPTPTEQAWARAAWVWFPEPGATDTLAPEGTRYFQKTFALAPGQPTRATLIITADDQFTVSINGREVGKSSGETDAWKTPHTFDVLPFLRVGADNTVSVVAQNTSASPAGVIAALTVEAGGNHLLDVVTDASWQSGLTADGAGQVPVRVVAASGGGPWGKISIAGRNGVVVGPGRYVRREFALSKSVRRARLYASALGVYEPYINGKRVGSDVFAPGWTDYRKRVMYQTYDVTDRVRRGTNALGFAFADGWYAGHVGLVGRNVYGATPAVWGLLRIEYTDGTQETIATNEAWRGTREGPVVAADLLMGETYDARREAAFAGWNAPDYSTGADWTPAQAVPVGTPLEAQRGPAVAAVETLPTRKITQPTPGHYVFDLGQNMSGWARLRVRGAAGSAVTLRFAEMLNPNGTLYTANYRGARCTDTYTLRGDKRGEEYEPHFTFRGFRYVEVTGWPADRAPDRDAITGVVVQSDTPRVGAMETSSPLVNQLLQNIDWGQRGNFLSVPTDCPQRDERLGWMGDAQIFVRTATYNRDVNGFFQKWLVDVDDAQAADGAFSDVSPRVTSGEGVAAWGDAGVICPWTIYLAYGDRRILQDHYPAMRRWIAWCRFHSTNLLRPATGYGDWLSIQADTPRDLLATAYFAYSTHLTAQTARALGHDSAAAEYDALFAQIRAAFNRAYVAPDGRIKGDTQTGYLLALRFDLLPDALRPLAARYLAENVALHNNHLSTGFVGVGYLCPVLSDTGRDDLAFRLLYNDTFPSWGYSIRQGATTMWERWDGYTDTKGFQTPAMNSFNHYSFGSVGEWLYGDVAGIEADPAAPGYRHTIIRPHVGQGMTFARARLDTPYGELASAWQTDGRTTDFDVTIPVNTTATVYIPTTNGQVREGVGDAGTASGVRFIRFDGRAAVYEVESGTYHFHAK